jgi:hypothetical protein
MTEPYEKVADENYFRGVLKNMSPSNSNKRVRFGKEGEGIAPNYQVCSASETERYSGLSHKVYHDNPGATFDEEHLSPGEYTYADVQQMIAKRRP